MRNASLWRALLGVENTVIEEIEFDEETEVVVAHVRPRRGGRGRCGTCGTRASWYDHGEGRRRWRSLDVGVMQVFLEADAPRVNCPVHGPTVRQVPWARHAAGHTLAFDQQVAWLATQCSKSAITELMRIAWRTVGAIITRVWSDTAAQHDLLAGLRRIGIDEISYKRNHKYLTVVVDHDTGRLVWVGVGREKATVRAFFDVLGPERCAQITHVSADGAAWIGEVVTERCPNAVRCADPFHVVKWATTALDEVRRQAWNAARSRTGQTPSTLQARRAAGKENYSTGPAKALKNSRFALWKNPENLTTRQAAKLTWIAKAEPTLHRAYLLKEALRLVFQLPHHEAVEALEHWISWARRSRIERFVKLQRTIVTYKAEILAAIEHGLSNGLIESVNTKIRLITRVAFGFRSPDALIALAMLNLGGHRPVLPGR
ncbi:transposase [Nocardioides sp. J9]|uniref:ISL3 family transposase n=1 Tax=Nocardioides sp. J9 TaxID=935844 RepID=UPI00119E57C9|nr:ISL3 family transposase [Nocardioides sp. J9]TWG98333.1 transposase [Nocardioides sp. J9]TWH00024.1 transposase [Nocardioides sp. J9]TWH02967.1 transposase [Nocardioides sp. J9]TWH04240.1 transposase [Nocardioides sp. J9]